MVKRNSELRKAELNERRLNQHARVSAQWWPTAGQKGNKYVPAGENKNV